MKNARLALCLTLALAIPAEAQGPKKKPSDDFAAAELKSLESKDLAIGVAGYLDDTGKPRNDMGVRVSRVVSKSRLIVHDLNDKKRPFILDVPTAGIVDDAAFVVGKQFPGVAAWIVTKTAKVGGRTMFVVEPITGTVAGKR